MKDKVIVITGASMGIGAALAEVVARRGARVVLSARGVANLSQVAAKIGDAATVVPADVTKRADMELLRDRALAKHGQIDVWVNNAGRAISRMPSQLTDEDIDEMTTVNVKSVLYGIQAVLPHFKQRGAGQIVTISSGLSRFPFAPQRSAYSMAKAAVNLLMASLRMELKQDFPGIHCTTVLPGVVATDFGLNAMYGGVDNRKLPGAQAAEEVAGVIADAIETPVAETYTRPQMRDLAVRYFGAEDVATVESGPPFSGGR